MERRKIFRGRRKPKASTRDVVGANPGQTAIAAKWQKYYNRLVDLREHVLKQRFELNQDALQEKPQFGTHMADAGTDSYDRDFALGLLSSDQDALYEIEEALQRIRSGNFGICELTGRWIEAARLDAIPWTRFSAEAERQLEREGLSKRPRLGPREAVAKTDTGRGQSEST